MDFGAQTPQASLRFVVVGDSFSEGVGDELPDGTVRGWADLVAQGLADALGEPIQYANFAIRGKKITEIITEQLPRALELQPTLVSFNGGGNDMLRPSTDIAAIMLQTRDAVDAILASGAQPLLLAGADPTIGIPQGKKVRAKGDELTAAAHRLAAEMGLQFCDNWSSPILKQRGYWSPDRLHLAPVGHHRVAANVLQTLGYPVPETWQLTAPQLPKPGPLAQLQYTKEHVLPWLKRRLTGTSSGDGRLPKYPAWVWIHPSEAQPGAVQQAPATR